MLTQVTVPRLQGQVEEGLVVAVPGEGSVEPVVGGEGVVASLRVLLVTEPGHLRQYRGEAGQVQPSDAVQDGDLERSLSE